MYGSEGHEAGIAAAILFGTIFFGVLFKIIIEIIHENVRHNNSLSEPDLVQDPRSGGGDEKK